MLCSKKIPGPMKKPFEKPWLETSAGARDMQKLLQLLPMPEIHRTIAPIVKQGSKTGE